MSVRFPFAAIPLLVALALLAPGLSSAQTNVQLPEDDRSLSVRVEDVFSVGSLAGEEWETFSAVSGVSFDAEGNLYILDRQNFRVVKVDPQGRFLAEMGRAGEGPGELGMPLAFSVTREGEVRVFDLAKQGFAVFNPDGSFDRTVPMGTGTMYAPSGGLLSHPRGGVLDGGTGGMTLMIGSTGGETASGRRQLRYLDLGDEVEMKSVYEGWNPASENARPSQVTTGGGIKISASPQRGFDPKLMAGILPDGRVAVVDSTTYEVKLVDLDHGVADRFRRPLTPRPVTRRDREEEMERQLAEAARRTVSGSGGFTYSSDGRAGRSGRLPSAAINSMLEERIRSMDFGEEIPVVSGLSVDWEGQLWVKRAGPRVGEEGPLDVLTGEGTYLGTLAPGLFIVPDAFGPGGLAAWIEKDEMDVPRVVVRRVVVR